MKQSTILQQQAYILFYLADHPAGATVSQPVQSPRVQTQSPLPQEHLSKKTQKSSVDPGGEKLLSLKLISRISLRLFDHILYPASISNQPKSSKNAPIPESKTADPKPVQVSTLPSVHKFYSEIFLLTFLPLLEYHVQRSHSIANVHDPETTLVDSQINPTNSVSNCVLCCFLWSLLL